MGTKQEHYNLIANYLNGPPFEKKAFVVCSDNGSRAWGYNHEKSDYDYKGVFVSTEYKAYLSPFELQQTLDTQLAPDVSLTGWDLKKYMNMLWSGNAQCYELVESKHQLCDSFQHNRFKDFSLEQLKYRLDNVARHYYGLSKSTMKKSEEVTCKKWLYVLRPLLSVHWMMQNKFELPPLDFETLLDQTEFDKETLSYGREFLEKRRLGVDVPKEAFDQVLLEAHVDYLSKRLNDDGFLVESKQTKTEQEQRRNFNEFYRTTLKYFEVEQK